MHEAVHPLFIPRGSVRALVTLIVVGASCFKLVKGESLSVALTTALFVVIAYYFAHRGARGSGTNEGPSPLYLPRGVIRTLLTCAIVGTFGWLIWQKRLFDEVNRVTVVTLLSFFAGISLQVFYKFRRKNPGVKTPFLDLFDHLKAVVVLGAAVHLGLADVLGWEFLQGQDALVAALGAIAFYFGSR